MRCFSETDMRIGPFLAWSVLLRAGLICYGELQDRWLAVKYTDIDYSVFTDAARFVARGESPFLRSTYRYSPLLAYLVLPNVLVSRLWGKALFAAADVVAAWQIWRIGQLQHASAQRCFWSAALWLYNPFTVTISTRGSCDSVVTVMLLAVLLLLLQGRRTLAALLYGLAVHVRVYPIIYAPAIVLHLAQQQLLAQGQPQVATGGSSSSSMCAGRSQPRPTWMRGAKEWLAAVVRQGALFGGVSGGVFLLLGALFWRAYGEAFLAEAFLYHLGRRDPRHSFSPYYYPVYLESMPGPPTQQPLPLLVLPDVEAGRFAAMPQMLLVLVFAAAMHRNLPACWLLQTVAFVSLNKVSTAQYFVWYFSLLPVALLSMPWPLPWRLRGAGLGWVVTQLNWLLWAFLLEFQGQGAHLLLWGAGQLFLFSNVCCMWALLDCCANGDAKRTCNNAKRW